MRRGGVAWPFPILTASHHSHSHGAASFFPDHPWRSQPEMTQPQTETQNPLSVQWVRSGCGCGCGCGCQSHWQCGYGGFRSTCCPARPLRPQRLPLLPLSPMPSTCPQVTHGTNAKFQDALRCPTRYGRHAFAKSPQVSPDQTSSSSSQNQTRTHLQVSSGWRRRLGACSGVGGWWSVGV